MLLVVPGPDEEPWPTIGPQVCDFIEDRGVYGKGSLEGLPYVIDPEFRAFLHKAFEVFPRGHEWAGRRRFQRVGLCVRKGLAKTEKQALIVFAHIHPEGPAKCDGFDASGNPVAAPITRPYVPMLAFSKEQVEELAYGTLCYIVENSPDTDLFDVSQERIIRYDEYGREDGKALPLAQSPNARDGALTTLNAYDEPHRMYLPRHIAAHNTMDGNLEKRPLEDPWALYVGTAGEPGQDSVAENLHREAEMIRDGKMTEPKLFYLYRTDNGGHDLTDKAQRIQAVKEATGPAGEWGPGQFDGIASKWDRPGADWSYLERVWLNRWTQSAGQAFDVLRWAGFGVEGQIPKGSLVTAGFDGARRRDSTAIVITDVRTGVQELFALWERPDGLADDAEWEVSEREVHDAVQTLFEDYRVWRFLGDPPYWITELGTWAGQHEGLVEEWWTERTLPMAKAVWAYRKAQDEGQVRWSIDHPRASDLARHIGNAGKKPTNYSIEDGPDEGTPLYVLQKIHPDRKYDAAMAAILSWIARVDALAKGALKEPERKTYKVRRLR